LRAAGFLAGVVIAAGLAAAFGAGLRADGFGVGFACTGAALTGSASNTGATCGAASTLYGAASGCTAGANALGDGCRNQSKIALSIDISYQVFTIDAIEHK
jgi:hypothetical protein